MRGDCDIIKTIPVVFVIIFLLVVSVLPDTILRENNRSPNIIFILTDDLGWGDLGCYGNESIQTPYLDQLAKEGTLFTQFYVNSAVCSPSRAAFMTGQYPARHRIHGHFASHQQNRERGMPDWLDPKELTIIHLLKLSGYATAHFGKWHLCGEGINNAPSPSAYDIDDHKTLNSTGMGWGQREKELYFRAESTGMFVDEAIRFIEMNRDRPFYINLWTLVPHATLHPTEKQMKPYERFGPKGFPYKGAMQIYYATVTEMDKQLGRLFTRLDELKLSENTIIIFSSDNGPEDIHVRNASHSGVGSPGPLRGRKRSLYEGGIRMPFIVRWPGHVPANRVDDNSVITAVDFLPTMCQLAGVNLPNGYQPDGEDVSDMLLKQTRPRKKAIFWEWRFRIWGHNWHKSPMLVIREDQWKLLINPDKSRVELYDIPADPMELNNLADHRPNIVKQLSQKLLTWQLSLPEGPVESDAGKNDYPWPGISN